MGGPNLEVFKFGMYIMFPIGFMYYFGINLDSRFAVPDFWPKKGQTHEIPFERDEIRAELERLRERRLAARKRRLEVQGMEGEEGDVGIVIGRGEGQGQGQVEERKSAVLEAVEREGAAGGKGRSGLMGWFK